LSAETSGRDEDEDEGGWVASVDASGGMVGCGTEDVVFLRGEWDF
jgi:hypothetical protein